MTQPEFDWDKDVIGDIVIHGARPDEVPKLKGQAQRVFAVMVDGKD